MNSDAFGVRGWALAVGVAMIWGSSFLWTAIGLDSFAPTAVAFGRVALGAATLWAVPGARRPVDRSAWPVIVAIAVAGNAGPALLFALAQQHVESSVAGMINASTPIATVLLGITVTGRSPGVRAYVGIGIGFAGVAMMSSPSLAGAEAQAAGIALLVVAVIGYGLSNNVIVAPQRQYGSLPIVSRALIVGTVLLAPAGVPGLADSALTASSLTALLILGVIGTGAARALNASLIGRTGPARASIVLYLAPVIAISLGVAFRGERVEPIELVGIATTLLGAYLTTRPQRVRVKA